MHQKAHGFTIVELLIVIVIIAILAAITLVSYNGITTRARDAARQSDISNVQKLVESYYALNGSYPKTVDGVITTPGAVRTDANCETGTKSKDWVPGLDTALPQSTKNTHLVKGQVYAGCYAYASNGDVYVISAWGNIDSGPQTTTMYRRIGFRELAGTNMSNTGGQVYCNHKGAIGGIMSGTYNIQYDYYKYSYTASNITCDETPPTGA